MLKILIPLGEEKFDEKTNEFIYPKVVELQLEHSLVSVSKWESKWLKPFLTKENKTTEEAIDYIRCMVITQNVDPEVYNHISKRVMDKISNYIEAPMTASTISHQSKATNKQVVTSELVYYWMVAFNIPFECQKWHLNRLLTLIDICSVKNQPPKKMKKAEALSKQRALNEARKAKYGTKG